MATQQESASSAGELGELGELDDFAKLLQKEFKPKTDQAKSAVQTAVHTLAQQALADTNLVSADVYETIDALISAIDVKLAEQINLILHHEDFTKLEGAWRGLHYLVGNTETDSQLKIRVMNISKKDLHRTLKSFKKNWDQSPIFKKVYEEEFGVMGGQPFGCLVGDFHFDHSPVDVEIMSELSHTCASAHVPFISGASPTLLQMDSWRELSDPRDLSQKFENSEYAAWHSFRKSENSRYIGLAMPRFLARLPYGAKTNPIDSFEFEEEIEGSDHNRYVWANSAYAMATNITRAFKLYGWCTTIRGVESGGAVPNLPVHSFPTDDGGTDMKCPTEIGISDRREAELAKNGLMPLVHRKHEDFAAFIGAQSLQKPAEYTDPDATANANLAARLPYLFASCRFAHYLKCMVRDKVGSFASAASMQRELSDWINQFVDGSPEISSDTVKAQRPLSAAEVIVEEVEGNPGYYTSRFMLRPHYQLEGMTVSLRLVSKLPSQKTA